MIRYRYRQETGSIGKVLRPVADVILENGIIKVEVSMYIDSGADISMIPLRFGRALGFNQQPSDTIYEIRGISGGGIPYILKEATFIVDNKRLKTRIAWALVENVPLIIGRMDIFNQFRITFDEKKGWIDFED